MKNKKTSLWLEVCETNPEITKKVGMRGGFTAIDAQSQVKRATEVFGPFGFGWGTRDETFNQPITGVIIYQATLYYNFNDIKGEFTIHSSIILAANNKIDDEAVKKVATDALTKGLSKLGFNSDVFEGKFDDNRYINQLKQKFTPQITNQQKAALEALFNDELISKEDRAKAKEWLIEHNANEDHQKEINRLKANKSLKNA